MTSTSRSTPYNNTKESFEPQSTHRVAIADFWHYTSHHDGKISPGWWGWGVHAHPPFHPITITYKVAVYAPAERADTLPLFHLYPYMYSVVWAISKQTCLSLRQLIDPDPKYRIQDPRYTIQDPDTGMGKNQDPGPGIC